ncbi:arylformamidase [Frankia sp. AiPs1]|uniref:cyclase family protein n=1 Tax=Frankia sp. AiPa1 TaxID=573492 RepID=UPI00202B0310|nr:cyclase family protein [Frankia sp. AiPa1]MCL9759202.1 cyclase family protein [Frankia sp. AiPa1]
MTGGELIDLSVPIIDGMPVYPGDPQVRVVPALRATEDGANVQRLHLGSQTGTHVDAPWHIDDALPRLDQVPLDRFTGPAVPVDARGLGPRTPVVPALLPAGLRTGDIVLIVTDWSTRWGQPGYLDHPYLAVDTARALVDAGVRTVGIDAPSVDPTPPATSGPTAPSAPGSASPDAGLAAHRVLCGAGAVIVENLTGLDRLLTAARHGRSIEMFLFPLPLAAADGAPVRAIARLGA